MKLSDEQLEKIKKINETIKDLDPILKERIVDLELYDLFKDDYLKIAPFIKRDMHHKMKSASSSNIGEQGQIIRDKTISTIKEFFDEKKPLTAAETVAVFGYFLERYENKTEFTEADISKAFFDARVRKPKVVAQALRDAKNKKGFLVDGHEKGSFRLSNIGENLILHDLPHKD